MAQPSGDDLAGFLFCTSWSDSRYRLVLHPELLQPVVDEIVEMLIASGRQEKDEARVRVLEQQLGLLRLSRQVGIDAAFAELSGRPRAFVIIEDHDMVRQQAEDAQQHYERTGNVSSLNVALDLWLQIYTEIKDPAVTRRVIEALGESIRQATPDSAIQFVHIACLGYASFQLFALTQDMSAMKRALPVIQRSLPDLERSMPALENSGADPSDMRELHRALEHWAETFTAFVGA